MKHNYSFAKELILRSLKKQSIESFTDFSSAREHYHRANCPECRKGLLLEVFESSSSVGLRLRFIRQVPGVGESETRFLVEYGCMLDTHRAQWHVGIDEHLGPASLMEAVNFASKYSLGNAPDYRQIEDSEVEGVISDVVRYLESH